MERFVQPLAKHFCHRDHEEENLPSGPTKRMRNDLAVKTRLNLSVKYLLGDIVRIDPSRESAACRMCSLEKPGDRGKEVELVRDSDQNCCPG